MVSRGTTLLPRGSTDTPAPCGSDDLCAPYGAFAGSAAELALTPALLARRRRGRASPASAPASDRAALSTIAVVNPSLNVRATVAARGGEHGGQDRDPEHPA